MKERLDYRTVAAKRLIKKLSTPVKKPKWAHCSDPLLYLRPVDLELLFQEPCHN